jgi:hypothetical protein
VLEADASYTAATLETGPASRALASSLWPGSLLGDGIGTVTQGNVPTYPVKADARYPDKPYTSTAQDNGALMQAQALGLDVRALARANPGDLPGAADVGAASSVTTATVKDGVAVGTAVSRVSGVQLLGGLISVGSVATDLTVKGDGRKASSDGDTVVTGLQVAGVGFQVDQDGAHLVGPTKQGTPPLPGDALSPLKQLGITVSGIAQKHQQDATTASRDAAGLRITVDTVVLRKALDNVPGPVWDALYGIVNQMPKEAQGTLYYLLGATPQITFVLGASTGTASATLPLSFQLPDLGGLPLGGPLPPAAAGGAPGSVGAPVGPPAAPLGSQPAAPGPVVAGPTGPVLVKSAFKDPFKGLPSGHEQLVLLGAGLGGWLLVRLQSAALRGGAAAGACDGSAPTLPDLRGA